VACPGAFIEQLRGERGQAGQLGRVVIGAGVDQRPNRHQRRVVVLRHQHAQAVGQRAPGDAGEVIGAGRAGLGGLRAVDAHASPAGAKMLVTRFSGTRYCAAMLAMASRAVARYGSSHVWTSAGPPSGRRSRSKWGNGPPEGMSEKYCSTSCFASPGTKSPITVSTALSGRYQVRKKSRMSSSEAAPRSSIEPMVGQW